jgi:hypothetical protein
MKNKLVLLLKTLFASKGFSQKALEGLADYLAPNLTEESTDADLTAAIETIKPMTDLMQSEINRQVNAAKPKPVEEIKPVTTTEPKPADDPNETPTEKLLKQALAGITALTAEVANIKGEKVTNTRREQYAKTLEGTSDAYKAEALKDFDRLSFKDDTDYTEWVGAKAESVKVFVQEAANGGLGGDRPAGGVTTTIQKGEASQAEIDEAFKNFKL